MALSQALSLFPFDACEYLNSSKLERELFIYSNYINKRIRFDDILKNKQLNSFLDQQDNQLKDTEYNLHDRLHSENVMAIAERLVRSLDYKSRINNNIIEDCKIASLLHDIGNIRGRIEHSHKGSEMAEVVLLQMISENCDVDYQKLKRLYERYKVSNFKNRIDLKITRVFNQILIICYAIATHSELHCKNKYKENLVSLPAFLERNMDIVSTAVYFGDKFDNGKSRVRDARIGTKLENEHTRVNYCVNNCDFELSENCIKLYFKLNSENLIELYKEKGASKYNTEELYSKCKDEFTRELIKIYKGKFIRSHWLAKETFRKDYKILLVDKLHGEISIDIAKEFIINGIKVETTA